jgi:hypothetical protein
MYFIWKECAMRNLQGKLIWVIVRSFFAVMLLVVLSATICQAQCFENAPYGQIPGATITPQNWAPEQSYVVTIMSPTYPDLIYCSSYGSWVEYRGYVVTTDNFDCVIYDETCNNFSEDPYVSRGTVVYVGPGEIEFTVSVAANAPTENDYFVSECGGSIFSAPVTITPAAQIPPDNGSNLGPCRDDPCSQAGGQG